MKKIIFSSILFLVIIFAGNLNAQSKQDYDEIIGSAFTANASYDLLERICDEAGGRFFGSAENGIAINILKAELNKIGCIAELETFDLPGWERGDDRVIMKEPEYLKLRAIALGYVDKTPAFTTHVVYASYGFNEDYEGLDAAGKIVLVTQETPPEKEGLLRYEMIDIAAAHKAKAVLFINNRKEATNLAGAGNFNGTPTKVPAYSLTFEEGKRLQRLIEKNIAVKMEITTNSYCKKVTVSNVAVTFKGEKKDKLIIGAHIDSWDVGQGAIDNGTGTAVLFDIARLLKKYNPHNYYTIELVWFNGEELGLWGSRKYTEMHKKEKIIAMINLDMPGSPTGFNLMGFDEYENSFKNILDNLNGFGLNKAIVSIPYTNSDHMPFMFEGIPVFSVQSHLDEDMYKFYHDKGDTFDKVNIKYLSETAAVVSVAAVTLANDKTIKYVRKSDADMISLFKKFHLDKRLKRQGEWKYKID